MMVSASEFDVHAALHDGRLRLSDHLDQLAPDDWQRPSLCAGWTVVDVVAHLASSTTGTWRDFIVGMIRNLGDFDRWNASSARTTAQRHTHRELVGMLRASADSRDHGPGSSPLDQLVDLLVHGQDISLALDSPLDLPLGPTRLAVEHAVGSRWYGARKRFAGIRLVATDAQWEAGDGDEIRGPIGSLLLLATGRVAGLADVEGPGAEVVARRLEAT